MRHGYTPFANRKSIYSNWFSLIRLLFLYECQDHEDGCEMLFGRLEWLCVRIILSPLTLTHVVAINFGMKREAILFKFLSTKYWFVL